MPNVLVPAFRMNILLPSSGLKKGVLKMEAVYALEMLVCTKSKRRYNPATSEESYT
jgi:hypothetical protein